MTLSSPSSWAAFTRSSIVPKSSTEVADAASLLLLELSSDGGEQPARAADEARATNETNAVRTFMGPPDVGALGATPR